MCLITTLPKQNRYATSQKCYKILLVQDGKYYTPFRKKCLGEKVEHNRFGIKKQEPVIQHLANNKVSVTKGFYHAYKNLELAKKFLEQFNATNMMQYELWECTIPAQVDFYENDDEICGRSIFFMKKL